MSPERIAVISLAVVVVIAIFCALLLASGSTWPTALLGGLGAGGATLVALPSLMKSFDRDSND
ncbi:hypothetical protein [Nonomuraea sp. NPDC003754]